MIDFILKITFIFLWASAFVAAKLGLNDAGPFSMLAVRFTLVTCMAIVITLACNFSLNFKFKLYGYVGGSAPPPRKSAATAA